MCSCPGARLLLAAALAASATGCATFIDLEDAEGHLPRLDGNYLIAIDRLRADGMVRDFIKLRGTARLDLDTRTLDLSLSLLRADNGAPFTETSITDIAFAGDGIEAPFTLNIAIPDAAVTTPQLQADQTLNAPVMFYAEDDYSFCARPTGVGATTPTLGTVLLAAPGDSPPADADCDVPRS